VVVVIDGGRRGRAGVHRCRNRLCGRTCSA
jgi:hypothetical protein